MILKDLLSLIHGNNIINITARHDHAGGYAFKTLIHGELDTIRNEITEKMLNCVIDSINSYNGYKDKVITSIWIYYDFLDDDQLNQISENVKHKRIVLS